MRHGVQAEVFEEIPTDEFAFEGIPTVPPRKDMDHFAFFCDGCRYRCARPLALHPLAARSRRWCLVRSVKGSITETAAAIKRRLWEGGCGCGADMTTGKRKVISRRVHAGASVATRYAAPALCTAATRQRVRSWALRRARACAAGRRLCSSTPASRWPTTWRWAITTSRRCEPMAAGCVQTQRQVAVRDAEARAACAQGCKCMIAIDARLLRSGKPDPDDAYWN